MKKEKILLITIDTEMDCDINWNRPLLPTFTSITSGIPNILRPIWDRYNVNPLYFVSPEVLKNQSCCDILKNEIQKGAFIGAHLHAEYIEPNIISDSISLKSDFPCFSCEEKIEKEKIINLTKLIEEKLEVKPYWYRAARFGADINTIKILAELGYKYDSSVTPGINWISKGGPNHALAPLTPYHISKKNLYKSAEDATDDTGIIEYPVTILGKRFGFMKRIFPENWLFYNWLRPTHMTLFEQKNIIDHVSNDLDVLIMMFHSTEIMINKTPYVRNKLMLHMYLSRLEKTIQYAKMMNYNTLITGLDN